jgi:hypothetical protein
MPAMPPLQQLVVNGVCCDIGDQGSRISELWQSFSSCCAHKQVQITAYSGMIKGFGTSLRRFIILG